jgi:hypothetical protein
MSRKVGVRHGTGRDHHLLGRGRAVLPGAQWLPAPPSRGRELQDARPGFPSASRSHWGRARFVDRWEASGGPESCAVFVAYRRTALARPKPPAALSLTIMVPANDPRSGRASGRSAATSCACASCAAYGRSSRMPGEGIDVTSGGLQIPPTGLWPRSQSDLRRNAHPTVVRKAPSGTS